MTEPCPIRSDRLSIACPLSDKGKSASAWTPSTHRLSLPQDQRPPGRNHHAGPRPTPLRPRRQPLAAMSSLQRAFVTYSHFPSYGQLSSVSPLRQLSRPPLPLITSLPVLASSTLGPSSPISVSFPWPPSRSSTSVPIVSLSPGPPSLTSPSSEACTGEFGL